VRVLLAEGLRATIGFFRKDVADIEQGHPL
jgi:hypothetical protein